jgi:hypothetical protein
MDHNPKVAGSNPAPAIIIQGIAMTYKVIMGASGYISNSSLTEFPKTVLSNLRAASFSRFGIK